MKRDVLWRRRRVTWLPLLLLLLLVLLPVLLVSAIESADIGEFEEEEAPRQLVPLTDRNFEHDTQAATGQTTGSWVVLFTDLRCDKCKDAEQALLKASTEQQPIPAQVNVLDSPKTCKRFLVSHVPELRLFRDRLMYTYKGAWNTAAISAFIQGSWKDGVGEVVPAEDSSIFEYFEGLSKSWQASLEYFSRRPGLLAGIGAILATGAYTVTLRVLGLRPSKQRKAPRGRPVRRRAD